MPKSQPRPGASVTVTVDLPAGYRLHDLHALARAVGGQLRSIDPRAHHYAVVMPPRGGEEVRHGQ